jgi:hypothetical protein
MATNGIQARTASGNDIFASTPAKKRKVQPKVEAMPAIQVGAHGRYQIKSGWLGGTFVARAFPKPPARARELIAEAVGATEEAAIAALHVALDERETSRSGSRRTDADTGSVIPSVAEYSEAIRQVDLSKQQRTLLDALSYANEDGLTETRLAREAGYKSRMSVRRALASAGMLIADFLSIDTATGKSREDLEGTSLVGHRGTAATEEAPITWLLHGELREALRATRA